MMSLEEIKKINEPTSPLFLVMARANQLREENRKLRKALEEIYNLDAKYADLPEEVYKIVETALKEQGDEKD